MGFSQRVLVPPGAFITGLAIQPMPGRFNPALRTKRWNPFQSFRQRLGFRPAHLYRFSNRNSVRPPMVKQTNRAVCPSAATRGRCPVRVYVQHPGNPFKRKSATLPKTNNQFANPLLVTERRVIFVFPVSDGSAARSSGLCGFSPSPGLQLADDFRLDPLRHRAKDLTNQSRSRVPGCVDNLLLRVSGVYADCSFPALPVKQLSNNQIACNPVSPFNNDDVDSQRTAAKIDGLGKLGTFQGFNAAGLLFPKNPQDCPSALLTEFPTRFYLTGKPVALNLLLGRNSGVDKDLNGG